MIPATTQQICEFPLLGRSLLHLCYMSSILLSNSLNTQDFCFPFVPHKSQTNLGSENMFDYATTHVSDPHVHNVFV